MSSKILCAPDKVTLIPNGVDVSHFNPVDLEKKSALRHELQLAKHKIIIYTGSLKPHKGLKVLLLSWSQLDREEAATLLIVGKKVPRQEYLYLSALVEQLDLSASVRFTGEVTDVAPYLQAADIFVMASHIEGLSVSMLEAMACGLPIVVTAVAGIEDVRGQHLQRVGSSLWELRSVDKCYDSAPAERGLAQSVGDRSA